MSERAYHRRYMRRYRATAAERARKALHDRDVEELDAIMRAADAVAARLATYERPHLVALTDRLGLSHSGSCDDLRKRVARSLIPTALRGGAGGPVEPGDGAAPDGTPFPPGAGRDRNPPAVPPPPSDQPSTRR